MQVLYHHLETASIHWVLSYVKEQRRKGVSQQKLAQEMDRLLPSIQPLLNQYQWQALNQQLASLHVAK